MKKWLITIISIIIILAAILLVVPFITGKVIATRYQYFLDQVAQTKYLNVKVISYERHWFNSSAVIQITLNPQIRVLPSQSPRKPITVQVVQNIMHGPILYAPVDGHKKLLFGLAYIHSEVDKPRLNFWADTHLKFDGSISYNSKAPLISISLPQEKRSFVFKNINIEGNTELNFNSLSGKISVASMNINDAYVNEQLTGFTADYDLNKTLLGLYLGDRNFNIQKLSLDDLQSKKHYEAQDIKIESFTKESSRKINLDLDISIGSTLIDGQNLGPHYLELEINKLDEPLLVALKQQLILMQQQGFSLLQFAKYNQLLLSLLSRGANIELKKLDIATFSGRASVNGKFNFEPTEKETANPTEIFKKLSASLSIKVPQALFNESMMTFYQWSDSHKHVSPENGKPVATLSPAQRAQIALDTWLKNKWLLLDGDYYVTQIAYQDHATFINGQPLAKEAAPPQVPAPTTTTPVPAATTTTTTTTVK